jgi:hypothetical protein
VLIVKCTTDFALREPDAETGFVSWFDMSIHHADSELAALGGARVALIHGGQACNYGEPIVDVLDADSAELHDLYSVFYDDDGGLKPPYANGGGQDVIYFSELEVATGLQGRKVEEALVRRTTEVLGGACAIAVMPVVDHVEAERWEAAGFTLIALAPTATHCGYVAMDLTMKSPPFVAPDAVETDAG